MGTFPVTDIRVQRGETIDGQEVWLVTYTRKEPSIEGPFDVFFSDWIAKDSFLAAQERATRQRSVRWGGDHYLEVG